MAPLVWSVTVTLYQVDVDGSATGLDIAGLLRLSVGVQAYV